MWFQIEFPNAIALTSLQFNSPPISRGWREGSPPPLQTFANSYEISTSKDGENWVVLDKGEGTDQDYKLDFNPVLTKYLKFKLTSTVEDENEIPWRIRQLKLYALNTKKELSK
jgi:hypothetical protein